MCGIAGFTTRRGLSPSERRGAFAERAARMVAAIAHRGPDAQQVVLKDGVALGHARLAIVDLSGGAQPMRDAELGLTVVFNGEIFNHVELREELSAQHTFRTRSDTEVILKAWATFGPRCLERFNGQFAFALWDERAHTLWLARDHVGICPLYTTTTVDAETGEPTIAFASEVKALLAGGFAAPALDAQGLKQALHLWAPVAPRTCFTGVAELPAGCLARFNDGELHVERWWELTFDVPNGERLDDGDEAARLLRDTLDDAVRVRLRADVPVGAYLSGGLDSSVICALAQGHLGGTLHTFSVAFANKSYDERAYQEEVARALGTRHHVLEIDDRTIGDTLPDVVRHAEQALIRSAPAPFFRLSRHVRELGMKVVLTGEGSDEFLLGYDLYRETKVRAFWAKNPASTLRPRLLQRLYPYLRVSQQSLELQKAVFGLGLDDPGALGFSHLVRFAQTARIARFFSPAFTERAAGEDPPSTLARTFSPSVNGYSVLEKAQLIEVRLLLAGYLLSSQGDRMLLGNAVEGRFPFLDPRVIALVGRMTERVKLRVLDEKHVLKQASRGLVPASVLARKKFPYRAPIVGALLGDARPAWVLDTLSTDAVRALGVFDPAKTERFQASLKSTLAKGATPSESDSMTLVAMATTQLLGREILAKSDVVDAARLARVEVQA
jgi:asparagine synthase (glutamine-hydrolysing)